MVARPNKLYFPPNKRGLGSLRVYIESTRVLAV